MSERVTILLPNYNNERFLRESLDSIIDQSFKDFRLIVIDDGSTDNSLNIIAEYQEDPRLEVIQKDSNTGIVDSLNIGLDCIQTEYMVRHDGDDVMHPQRLEMLVDFMDNHPDFGVCSSDVQYIGNSNGQLIYPRNWQENNANLIFGHSLAHAACIFRMNLFEENDIRYSNEYPMMEDYYLFYQLKKLTKTTSLPEALYLCRLWGRNVPSEMVERKRNTFLKFYKNILLDLEIQHVDAPQMHFELCKDVKPSFHYSQYKNHINSIIQSNDKLNIYPRTFLRPILDKYLNRMLHRLMDNQMLNFKSIIGKPQTWKYYISSKQRINRNKNDRFPI